MKAGEQVNGVSQDVAYITGVATIQGALDGHHIDQDKSTNLGGKSDNVVCICSWT